MREELPPPTTRLPISDNVIYLLVIMLSASRILKRGLYDIIYAD